MPIMAYPVASTRAAAPQSAPPMPVEAVARSKEREETPGRYTISIRSLMSDYPDASVEWIAAEVLRLQELELAAEGVADVPAT